MNFSKSNTLKSVKSLKVSLLPLLSTSIFYIFLHLYIEFTYSLGSLGLNLIFDWMLQVIIGYALFYLSRRKRIFLLTQFIFMSTIYLFHVIKANYLGAPVSIDDFLSFSALFNILDLSQKLLLIFPIASFFLLFLINIKID